MYKLTTQELTVLRAASAALVLGDGIFVAGGPYSHWVAWSLADSGLLLAHPRSELEPDCNPRRYSITEDGLKVLDSYANE